MRATRSYQAELGSQVDRVLAIGDLTPKMFGLAGDQLSRGGRDVGARKRIDQRRTVMIGSAGATLRKREFTMSGLDVDVEVHPPTAVITLAGDVDLETCPDVKAAAILALSTEAMLAEIVIDLVAVPFMDSSGLACLVDIRRIALKRNTGLRLRGAQKGPRRVLQITGLDSIFDLQAAPASTPAAT